MWEKKSLYVVCTWEVSLLMLVAGKSLGRSLNLWAKEGEAEWTKGWPAVNNLALRALQMVGWREDLLLIKFVKAAAIDECRKLSQLCTSRMRDWAAFYRGEGQETILENLDHPVVYFNIKTHTPCTMRKILRHTVWPSFFQNIKLLF